MSFYFDFFVMSQICFVLLFLTPYISLVFFNSCTFTICTILKGNKIQHVKMVSFIFLWFALCIWPKVLELQKGGMRDCESM